MLISSFESLPGSITFAILCHTDTNVNMNKNYSYRTTIYKSILTQMSEHVYLVLFTIFDLYHENSKANFVKIYFSTRNLYIWAKLFLCIVVE